jgi:hypothetical protein
MPSYKERTSGATFTIQELFEAFPNVYIPTDPAQEYLDHLNIEIILDRVPEKTLEQLMLEEKYKAENDYHIAIQNCQVSYLGKLFQADNNSLSIIKNTIEAFYDGKDVIWWWSFDNAALPMTVEELKELSRVIIRKHQELYKLKQDKKEKIRNIKSAEELLLLG